MNKYQDRVAGMLMGVALGDALGAPHEFKNSLSLNKYTGILEHASKITSRWQGVRSMVVGQVTDDTEMTLTLAQSIHSYE